MRYLKFQISNYKGIKSLELDLNILPDTKIYTLVGLNESGKTTILEAINDFEFQVPAASRHLLIAKNAAGGFTGKVVIEATLSFSEDDKKKIREFVAGKTTYKKENIEVADTLRCEQFYAFENSIPGEAKKSYWNFVKVKKTVKSLSASLGDDIGREVWTFVKNNLFPEVIFYRDFLSKFPEKIFLEPNDDKESEYVSIIEDVLVSIKPSYNVQSSLLDRLKNPSDANGQALEAVENELGAKISKIVFDAWNRIQNVSKKEIVTKTGQENGRHFIRLSVKDGHHTYAIAERSLGFRWFFTFLLYTEFRKNRIETSGEILFLLDEPASNLHQTAQKSLLDTFSKITSKSRLIYTTHSHHLINPIWLNTAYIIKNKGLEYKENDDFNASKTEIEAYKYKQFVAKYPNETSYFQPILDVLEYQPGLLELVPNIVITEGKFDYFVLKYFREIVFADTAKPYSFYPGHGASSLDLPIGLYESWGRKYIALLDADTEGKRQKERYIKEISNAQSIFTLEDADSLFKKYSMEDLFDESDKLAVSQEFNPGLTRYEKSAFNAGLQTLFVEKRVPAYLSFSTKEKIKKIIDFLNTKF